VLVLLTPMIISWYRRGQTPFAVSASLFSSTISICMPDLETHRANTVDYSVVPRRGVRLTPKGLFRVNLEHGAILKDRDTITELIYSIRITRGTLKKCQFMILPRSRKRHRAMQLPSRHLFVEALPNESRPRTVFAVDFA